MVLGWRSSEERSRKRREPEPREAGTGSTDSSSHQCTGCGTIFCSRSALFKHLRGLQDSVSQCSAVAATTAAEAMAAGDGSATATERNVETKDSKALEQAVVFALRRRLLRMGRRDAQQQGDTAGSRAKDAGALPAASTYTFDEDYAPLTWLAKSKKAKVQRSLINYIRSLPTSVSTINGQEQRDQLSGQALEQQGIGLTRTAGVELLSDMWWSEATEILRKFLQQESRKKLFDITVQTNRHNGSCIAAVRLTEHGLEPLQSGINASPADEDWDPVWSRVLALLEGQRSIQGGMAAGQGDHFLGRLASDVGMKRHTPLYRQI